MSTRSLANEGRLGCNVLAPRKEAANARRRDLPNIAGQQKSNLRNENARVWRKRPSRPLCE
eukprot:11064698-Lingulodinium_polyedra.AAC.1